MLTIIDFTQIGACISMLILAAVIDVKKREIPDKIWLGFGGFGAILLIIEIMWAPATLTSAPSLALQSLFGIGIMAPIAYVIYKTALFGGADSKALIAIAVLIPTYDSMIFKIHDFVALSVLSNALILSMSQVVYNSARNLLSMANGAQIFEGIEDESTGRKILAFAMGYRSKSPSGYLFAMEGIDEHGKRRFVFNPAKYDEFISTTEDEGTLTSKTSNSEGGKNNVATIADNKSSGKRPDPENQGIWVTQALPFIVYIAIGLVVTLTLGDLMAVAMQGLGFSLPTR